MAYPSRKSLVDVATGLISRDIFVSKDIYEQEQEQLFACAWLFVGHESQIPNPGDYFSSCMGEESVILTRDSAHRIHVFLNTCRPNVHPKAYPEASAATLRRSPQDRQVR